MAWAWRGNPVLTVTMVDDDLSKASFSLGLEGDAVTETLVPAYKAFMEDLADAVADISDAVVAALTITFTGYDDSFPTAPSGSEVERKGMFIIRDDEARLNNIEVPSILQTVLESDNKTIDLTNADVVTFVELLTEVLDLVPIGIGGDVEAANTVGRDYVSVEDAYQVHRKSRKTSRRAG